MTVLRYFGLFESIFYGGNGANGQFGINKLGLIIFLLREKIN